MLIKGGAELSFGGRGLCTSCGSSGEVLGGTWEKFKSHLPRRGWKGEVMAYGDGEEEGLRENPGSDSYGTGRRKANVWCLRTRGKRSHEQSTV